MRVLPLVIALTVSGCAGVEKVENGRAPSSLFLQPTFSENAKTVDKETDLVCKNDRDQVVWQGRVDRYRVDPLYGTAADIEGIEVSRSGEGLKTPKKLTAKSFQLKCDSYSFMELEQSSFDRIRVAQLNCAESNQTRILFVDLDSLRVEVRKVGFKILADVTKKTGKFDLEMHCSEYFESAHLARAKF